MFKSFFARILFVSAAAALLAAWCFWMGDAAEGRRVLQLWGVGCLSLTALHFLVVRRRRPEDKEAGVDTSGQGRD